MTSQPQVPREKPAIKKMVSTSVCPRCGAGFRCGMVANDAACWCADLPLLVELPVRLPDKAGMAGKGAPAASCFCPSCLESLTHSTDDLLPR